MGVLWNIFENGIDYYYAEEAENALHLFNDLGLDVQIKKYSSYFATFSQRCYLQNIEAARNGKIGGFVPSGTGLTEKSAIAMLKKQIFESVNDSKVLLVPIQAQEAQNEQTQFYKVMKATPADGDQMTLVGSIEVFDGYRSIFRPATPPPVISAENLDELCEGLFAVAPDPWS